MKVEFKSSVILLTTLFLGIVLGLVSQGSFQRLRERQVTAIRRPPGFVAHMEDVIAPTATQDSVVRPVLERTAEANQRIIETARAALRQSIDAMQRELTPVLTAEQRERLWKASRLPDPFRPPPRRDGPGPPPRNDADRRAGDPRDGPPDEGPLREERGSLPRDGQPPRPRDEQRPPPRK